MAYGEGARHRAMKGADASVVTRRAFYLRKIVDRRTDDYGIPWEILECGHEQRPVTDMIGETNAFRRRCRQCPKPAVSDESAGAYVDAINATSGQVPRP